MFGRSFKIYVLIISIAIVGLFLTQYIWVEHSIELANKEFRKEINSRLKSVTKKIEEDQLCFEVLAERKVKPGESFYVMLPDRNNDLDTLEAHYWRSYGGDTLYSLRRLNFSVPTLVRINLKFEYLLDKRWQDKDTLTELEERIINYHKSSISEEDFNTEHKLIDTLLLDRLLKQEIANYDNRLSFEYGVYDDVRKRFIYTSSSGDTNKLITSDINSIFFEETKFIQPLRLFVHFPGRQLILIKEEILMLIGSFSLIVLLSLLFIFFLRSILNQRKLTQMKVDFINNMTHEFNTPIANINLAIDTIQKKGEKLLSLNREKVMSIIKEENLRLKRNVDTLLNASEVGGRGSQLNKVELNIHELISKVIEIFELTHKDKKLHIESMLELQDPIVKADRIHITNVLHNLLDNAYKYSEDPVAIKITAKDYRGNIKIVVTDNGFGIKNSDQSLIYEKFYRVENNDRHDIKGFGLGLYYAKMIIEAHGGKFKLESEMGKGSSFYIILPIA